MTLNVTVFGWMSSSMPRWTPAAVIAAAVGPEPRTPGVLELVPRVSPGARRVGGETVRRLPVVDDQVQVLPDRRHTGAHVDVAAPPPDGDPARGVDDQGRGAVLEGND